MYSSLLLSPLSGRALCEFNPAAGLPPNTSAVVLKVSLQTRVARDPKPRPLSNALCERADASNSEASVADDRELCMAVPMEHVHVQTIEEPRSM